MQSTERGVSVMFFCTPVCSIENNLGNLVIINQLVGRLGYLAYYT